MRHRPAFANEGEVLGVGHLVLAHCELGHMLCVQVELIVPTEFRTRLIPRVAIP